MEIYLKEIQNTISKDAKDKDISPRAHLLANFHHMQTITGKVSTVVYESM